jgi:hypothetical protein
LRATLSAYKEAVLSIQKDERTALLTPRLEEGGADVPLYAERCQRHRWTALGCHQQIKLHGGRPELLKEALGLLLIKPILPGEL